MPINELELLAVKRLCIWLLQHARPKPGLSLPVQLWVDNTSAIAHVNKLRAPSFRANAIANDIAACREAGLLLDVAYIQSAANPADRPSRAGYAGK